MRAKDVVLLDVSNALGITDFFVLASGNSRRQLESMAQEIIHVLKRNGVQRLFMSGEKEGGWILIDFGEVVVHLFSVDARAYYELESLWEDAPRVPWQDQETDLDLARVRSEKSPPFAS